MSGETDFGGLDWALVVATYNRPDALKTCIALAMKQTRPPSEIIIVDASADWCDTHGALAAMMDARPDAPPLRYLHSEIPSLTVQRNAGVAAASAEIVFLIDDDSFMEPECAARIMAVYEADPAGAIVGVQAALTPRNPAAPHQDAADRKKDNARVARGLFSAIGVRRLRRLVMGRFFLGAHDSRFIPYDGAFHDSPEAAAPDVRPMRLFHGCRMTYRRKAVLAEPFDAALRFYCPYEDLDASYRISRHGALVMAQEARLHHAEAVSGRIDRYRVTLLSCLNLAFLLRRHAADHAAARRRYRALMRRHLLAELVKEFMLGRWRFPQLRAVMTATGMAKRLFETSPAVLEDQYTDLQYRIVKESPPPSRWPFRIEAMNPTDR